MRAVCQVCIQRQALAAMTEHAAEGLDRVGGADLSQVRVTGQAVFRLAGESGESERHRLRVDGFACQAADQQASRRASEAKQQEDNGA